MSDRYLPGKFLDYKKNHSGIDVSRKILHFMGNTFNLHLLRQLKCLYYFKKFNIKIGSRVSVNGLINYISIGRDNIIYDNCIFHFGPEARFTTGNNVTFAYFVLIACHKKIQIGNDVQIGEFTSIRDSTHRYNINGIMMQGSDVMEEIIIGNNVWIGRGCLITEGSVIEDGVVVAANSLVKGRLEKNNIYGGCPAKRIKERIENNEK